MGLEYTRYESANLNVPLWSNRSLAENCKLIRTPTQNERCMRICSNGNGSSNSKFSVIVIEIEKKVEEIIGVFPVNSARLLRSQSIAINIFCPSRELNLFGVFVILWWTPFLCWYTRCYCCFSLCSKFYLLLRYVYCRLISIASVRFSSAAACIYLIPVRFIRAAD